MKGRLLVGILVGAGFLYLALRHVNFSETWAALQGANYIYFLVLIALNMVGLWLRAVRWRYLLYPVRPITSGRLLPPLAIGLMANFIFPARAGEVVRAYLVGRKEGISKSATFATVVVERLFDGLAIISFLGLAPFFLRGTESALARKMQWAGLAVFVVYIIVLGVLLLLSHRHVEFSRFLANSGPARRWPLVERLARLVRRFIEGLAVLKSGGEVLVAVALSFVIWGLAGATNYMMMESVHLTLPFYSAFFLLVIQSFGVMIPSPGYVGPYQYAHIVALSVYGVPESIALSLALLIHSAHFISFIGAGMFFLFREHLSWGELERASTE